MTLEQYKQLETFKPIWEFYFKNFYLTSDHDLNGLAAWLKDNTGYSTDMNCSACKEQVMRMGRNIYEQNKKQYENITAKKQPKQSTSNKRR